MQDRYWGGQPNYTFGFNGKENDDEAKGYGNQVDYGMRVYDPRIGRFLSADPLSAKFAWYTPYQYAGNKPIWATDLDGLEENPTNKGTSEGETETTTSTRGGARGGIIITDKKEWIWHGGGLKIGQKWNKQKQTTDPVLSSAGWYSSEDYDNVLGKSGAAKALATNMKLSGSNWVNSTEDDKLELSKFVGINLSNNGANHLIAAAQNLSNKSALNSTGTIEPSSFNVEDLAGLGLLLRGGIKALATITIENIAEKKGVNEALNVVSQAEFKSGTSAAWKAFDKEDLNHSFSNIVRNYASGATKFSIKGADDVVRELYQIEGSLHGKSGRFEWLLENGKITHQQFIPGGTINGITSKK